MKTWKATLGAESPETVKGYHRQSVSVVKYEALPGYMFHFSGANSHATIHAVTLEELRMLRATLDELILAEDAERAIATNTVTTDVCVPRI